MSQYLTILLLEDEPLILMDLEFAAEDRGCEVLTATTSDAALNLLNDSSRTVDTAILDVSLGNGKTCFPVAAELEKRGIPYILHSGDLDRHNERVRELNAELIAKPASADHVVGTAIARAHSTDGPAQSLAAE